MTEQEAIIDNQRAPDLEEMEAEINALIREMEADRFQVAENTDLDLP
jgi:hypothetical protein